MSKKSNGSIKPVIEANERLLCSVNSCNKHRTGYSLYCPPHKRRDILHGSPTASGLVSKRGATGYERELTFVHELLIKNFDSLPVKAAKQLLRQWITSAQNGFSIAGSRLLSLIDDTESVLIPILTDISSIYIYSTNTKNSSERETTYVLANALFRHIPRTYSTHYSARGRAYLRADIKLGANERRVIGGYIRSELGLFLENVRQAWNTQTENKQNIKRNLMKSFTDN